MKPCPHCSAEVAPASRFCPGGGGALSPANPRATGPYQPAADSSGPPSPATPSTDQPRSTPGQWLARRYRVVSRLGKGGMGEVYRADDHKRQHQVALKPLQRLDATALYRLKQELRPLADATHPNLVALYELRADAGGAFLTMDLIAGVNFLGFVCSRGS